MSEEESAYAVAGWTRATVRTAGATVLAALVAAALVVGLLGVGAPASAAGRDHAAGHRSAAHPASAQSVRPARQPGTASIAGHVTYPGGYGTRTHYVVVRNGHYSRRVPVYRGGDYRIRNLPAGSYRVTFDRVSGFSDYEAQFWSGHPESAGVVSADRIAVGTAQGVHNVDGTLRVGGSITGTLVDGHQRPLTNCLLQAFTTDNHLVTRSTLSGADGAFAITGLTTGAYLVRVVRHGLDSDCDGGRQYVVTTGGGALGPVVGAVPVATQVGRATPIGTLDYATAGKIAGQVSLPAGTTTHDHWVVARNLAHPGFAKRARIHADGGYVLRGLITGSYRVTFDRLSGPAYAEASFYRGHPESAGTRTRDPVAVTRGDTTALRATSLRAGGTLSGALVGSDGSPLRHCHVQAYTDDEHLVTRTAVTGDDGSFVIGGLTTGDYLLRVMHGGRHTGCNSKGRRFYDGSRVLSLGGPLHPPRPVRARVGRDTAIGRLTYALGASISGRVTWPGPGYDWHSQWVTVRRGHQAVTTRLQSDGSWEVGGLAAGSYRVTFDRISGFSRYAAEFYDDHPEPATRLSADRVVVSAGEQRTGIDAAVAVGRVITGRLVDATGGGLRCVVQAFTTDGHLVTRDDYEIERDGTFHIGGLSAGRYYLRALGGSRGHCDAGTQYRGKRGLMVTTGPGIAVDTSKAATTSVGTLRYATALVAVAPPTISGTPRVGSRLTATPGQWEPPTGLGYAYQWLAGGQPIAGATGSSYTPTSADVGQPIAVRVTASKAGYASRSARSAPTAPVTGAAFVVKRPPQIDGQPTVGQVLGVTPAKISPKPATVTYQWLRNGRAIKKATSSTYLLVAADRGRQVSVTVTYARPGYADAVLTTAAVTVS